jgi:hypothetical protein
VWSCDGNVGSTVFLVAIGDGLRGYYAIRKQVFKKSIDASEGH